MAWWRRRKIAEDDPIVTTYSETYSELSKSAERADASLDGSAFAALGRVLSGELPEETMGLIEAQARRNVERIQALLDTAVSYRADVQTPDYGNTVAGDSQASSSGGSISGMSCNRLYLHAIDLPPEPPPSVFGGRRRIALGAIEL